MLHGSRDSDGLVNAGETAILFAAGSLWAAVLAPPGAACCTGDTVIGGDPVIISVAGDPVIMLGSAAIRRDTFISEFLKPSTAADAPAAVV